MLSSIFGSETSPAVQYVVAFAIIFVLLSGLALVLRRLTGSRAASSVALPEGNRNRQPRLGIIDIYELDRQRRLILLRRDNAEHLLLVGGPNDVVVETNIGRTQGARTGPGESEPERPEAGAERHPEPVAPVRPVIEAPRPPLSAVPPFAAETAADLPPPIEVPVSAADPVRVEPAQPALEPLRRPQRPPPPPARVGVGGRANEIAKAPEPARAPVPVAEAGRPRIEPSTRVGRPADPAALSDMARQLEEALRRPRPTEAGSEAALAFAALPEPLPPPTVRPVETPASEHAGVAAQVSPAPPHSGREPDLGASPGEPRAAEREVEAPPVARPPEPVPVVAGPPAPAASAPTTPPAPRPVAAPAPAPRPVPPAPAPAANAPPPAAAPAPAIPSDPARDPFSVEEIEAEFARLLGRPFEKAERG